MPQDQIRPFDYAGTGTTSFDAGLRKHMLRIYNYMAGGLGLTGLLAYIVANTSVGAAIFSSGFGTIVMLLPLAFLLIMQFRMEKLSFGALQGLFWAFCAAMGVSLSAVFLVYAGEDIARAFFVTAATFGVMSVWGYTSRRDLAGVGAFAMMGVFGIIVAMLVNIGIQLVTGQASSMLQWIVSVITVIAFTLLTAYDTQRLKQMYAEDYGVEANSKIAVMGALSLYINFINIFTAILRLTSPRN